MKNATQVTPDGILELGLGFWGSKTLLSAVELGVFTLLAQGPLDLESLTKKLSLHPRAARDFFDALVGLRMLQRTDGQYSNTPAADQFLDRNKPAYLGGILEMANARLYRFWGSLTEALRTGKPQNEARQGGNPFDSIYANPETLRTFLSGMTGVSMASALAIAERFPWSKYKSFADIGAAQGGMPVQVARAHPHLSGIGFDLAPVKPIFEEYVASHNLASRVKFQAGDFFKDALPKAEVLVMGHILHDWDLPTKKMLIAKAYDALPTGGALLVYEFLIDDDRRQPMGLLSSLNMLIETPGGFDYSGADGQQWFREAGFRDTWSERLTSVEGMIVGVK